MDRLVLGLVAGGVVGATAFAVLEYDPPFGWYVWFLAGLVVSLLVAVPMQAFAWFLLWKLRMRGWLGAALAGGIGYPAALGGLGALLARRLPDVEQAAYVSMFLPIGAVAGLVTYAVARFEVSVS